MAAQEEAPYKAIAARKQTERDARIPSKWRLEKLLPDNQWNVLDIPKTSGILTSEELWITETTDATALLEELRSGRVKAVDVARAFCKRAAVAHQVVRLAALY